ncbi:MAG: M16 family metallopeptidase [Blastocatellales bacterium]
MRIKNARILLLCVMLALPVVQAAGQADNFTSDKAVTTPYTEVNRDSLLNGLQIVTLERPSDQMVRCDIVIRTGSMFDLVGKTGLAMLTQESLMAANPRLREELESLQAKIDWGVDWDSTWFRIDVPASGFDTMLEIVARLLVVENVRTDAFKSAVQRHLSDLNDVRLPDATSADLAFFKAVYGEHPYGHNLRGTPATINNIKQGDIYEFIRRFYAANNASAIITGNIQKDRVMRAFKVFFGGWMKGQVVPPTFRPPRQIRQVNLVRNEVPGATTTELRAGLPGARIGDAEYLPSVVLARILEGRINKDAGSNQVSVKSLPRILPGVLMASASLPPVQASEYSRLITDQMAGLAQSAVSSIELQAAKADVLREYEARAMEDNLREIEVYSLPRNYPLSVKSKIESITAADLQKLARKMFDANALTVLISGRIEEPSKTTP